MKGLLLLVLGGVVACTPAKDGRPPHASSADVPMELFEACVGKAAGDACVMKVEDTEASGACATPPATMKDRRLICDGRASASAPGTPPS